MIALDLEDLLARVGATSFSFAASQEEAVAAARDWRPDIITSDVTLLEGTGPVAVAIIRSALGHIPVIYISGTVPECSLSDPMTRTLSKPMNGPAVSAVFQEFLHLNCA